MKVVPYNLALHDHLVALGYTWERVEATCIIEVPYDEYVGFDDMVFVEENGTIEVEVRNVEFEVVIMTEARAITWH